MPIFLLIRVTCRLLLSHGDILVHPDIYTLYSHTHHFSGKTDSSAQVYCPDYFSAFSLIFILHIPTCRDW